MTSSNRRGWEVGAALLLTSAGIGAAPPPTHRAPIPSAALAPHTSASRPGRPLQVATRAIPPFVFFNPETRQLTGFSVDLWQAIAEQLHLPYTLKAYPSVKGMLKAVQTGQADLAISAISITAERDQLFDFSQPMFDSGLQILVRSGENSGGLAGLKSVLLSPMLWKIIAVILLLVIIPAHLIYWAERRCPNGIVTSKGYRGGLMEAAWWAISTLATQAEEMPKSVMGRLIAVLWMFFSVVFVAYFTATVTANMTVQQLHGDIQGPDDLPGRRVATTPGSTSAEYLSHRGVRTEPFNRIEDAFEALERRQADAVVFDAPVLLYYSSREGKGKAQVVGPIFRKENYGIVFPENNGLRKQVNLALLTLKENGHYQRLYDQWFGTSESTNEANGGTAPAPASE